MSARHPIETEVWEVNEVVLSRASRPDLEFVGVYLRHCGRDNQKVRVQRWGTPPPDPVWVYVRPRPGGGADQEEAA